MPLPPLRSLGLVFAGLHSLAVAACSNAASTPPAGDGGAPGLDATAQDGAIAQTDGTVLPVGTVDAAGGEPCEASADCPSGLQCMYPLSEACSAIGVCTVLAASKCGGPYCTCRGDTTAACGDYGALPMAMPLHGPPCGAIDGDGGADGGQTDSGHDGA